MSSRRHEALAEVERIVCGDRDMQYGAPEDSFARMAAIANVVLAPYLAKPLDERAIAALYASGKLARLARDLEHRDSWIDLAGYGVCGASLP